MKNILLLALILSSFSACKTGELATHESKGAFQNMASMIAVENATRALPGNQVSALVTSVLYMKDGPFQLNVPNEAGGFSLQDSMALYRVNRQWSESNSTEYWAYAAYGKTDTSLMSVYPVDLPSIRSGELFSCMLDYAFCPKNQRAHDPRKKKIEQNSEGGGKQP